MVTVRSVKGSTASLSSIVSCAASQCPGGDGHGVTCTYHVHCQHLHQSSRKSPESLTVFTVTFTIPGQSSEPVAIMESLSAELRAVQVCCAVKLGTAFDRSAPMDP